MVTQSDVSIGWRSGLNAVSAGAWVNAELHEAAPDRISDLNNGHWGPSEEDFWLQYAGGDGRLRWSLGAMRYHLMRAAAVDANEFLGEIFVEANRWMPRLSLAQRLDRGGGTYLEPNITFIHLVNPFLGPGFALTTTAAAGIELQRGPGSMFGTGTIPAAGSTGLTHAALSSTLRFNLYLGSVCVFASAGYRLQFSRDSVARLSSDDLHSAHSAFHFWAPLTLGATVPMRRNQW